MESNENTVTNEAPEVASTEATSTETEAPVEQGEKGLELRDALEVALIAQKDKEGEKSNAVRDRISASSNAASGDRKERAIKSHGETPNNVRSNKIEGERGEDAPLSPPAEYTSEEKAYFSQLPRASQEAQLRLDKSRKARIEEIKAAQREYDYAKKLAESVTPYIKARGLKESPEVALNKALEMWRTFEEGDPKSVAAEYLRAKGIEPPKELLEGSTQQASAVQAEISPLQERLNLLEQKQRELDTLRTLESYRQSYDYFASLKNQHGEPLFPDSTDQVEAAEKIGTLVSGRTPKSQYFIAKVMEENPQASFVDLMAEAYKELGYRINNSPKSQSSQNHIQRSNRAAASVPGRSIGNSSEGVKKYKDIRDAIHAAAHDLYNR